jgi:hypothetical protein
MSVPGHIKIVLHGNVNMLHIIIIITITTTSTATAADVILTLSNVMLHDRLCNKVIPQNF